MHLKKINNLDYIVKLKIHLTGLTLPHLCACSKTGLGFSLAYVI